MTRKIFLDIHFFMERSKYPHFASPLWKNVSCVNVSLCYVFSVDNHGKKMP